MAFPELKQTGDFKEDEATLFPVSPSSECLSNSIISLKIFLVAELETPLNEFETIKIIRDLFLPLNARFSSIIDVNKKGERSWKKVNVRVEDHIRVPTFPQGLSREEYDEKLREYVSSIAPQPLEENRPLWEVHVIKYPTMNGAASLVFKFSHALGDGYAIIGIILSSLRRADDPSVPPSLPDMSLRATGAKKSFFGYFKTFLNTVSDVALNISKGSGLQDSITVIRSGKLGVEFEPIAVSTFSMSLEHLKHIKSKIGATINDVVTGLLYYAIHLYMLKKGGDSEEKNMTLLVTFNLRMLRGYENIDAMAKANIPGNSVGLLHADIPWICRGEQVDPMYFVNKAKEIMDRKKDSMEIFTTNTIGNILKWTGGTQRIAQVLHTRFRNTTATVTSVICAKEKLALEGHPVGSCYFGIAGIPQSLVFTAASYMGQMRLAVTMEKNFIDSELFMSCVELAFGNIYEAATSMDRRLP